ncbi:hypothetical protein KHQ81_04520 [Mycoplasmatota bacterium]|nr:hypothetical protein KHQ81_04520 [Mycoplasmatota bacterium]
MNREIKGQIHKVSKDYKLISIQIKNKLEFFYLQPRFVRDFRKYLYRGVFVVFSCDEKKFKMKRRLVSRVIAFEKILGNRYHRKFSYFDQKISRQNILDKLNQYDYRLFLDLEMTLQRSKYESEEIIQIGAILVDKNDQEVWTYNQFIKPTLINIVSNRTIKFLNIDENKIYNGINYQSFYDTIKIILLRYKPCVVVWGNNDKFALEKSYTINKVSPIFFDNDFINMQYVLKKYYNFNNELGLFNTAKIYQIDCGEQLHDAYDDARVTKLIFNKFYDIAFNSLDFDFKSAMKEHHSK